MINSFCSLFLNTFRKDIKTNKWVQWLIYLKTVEIKIYFLDLLVVSIIDINS